MFQLFASWANSQCLCLLFVVSKDMPPVVRNRFFFLFPRPTFSCIRLLLLSCLLFFSAAKQGSLREEGPLFRTPRQIETSTIDIFQDDKAFFSKIACHCSPSKAALAHWCLAVGGSSWRVAWPTAEGRKSTNETRRRHQCTPASPPDRYGRDALLLCVFFLLKLFWRKPQPLEIAEAECRGDVQLFSIRYLCTIQERELGRI